jgi:signal transduction histidine kinase
LSRETVPSDLESAAWHTPVALLVVDRHCRIVNYNPAAGALVEVALAGRCFCEAFRSEPCAVAAGPACLFSFALHGLERRASPRWVTLEPGGTARSFLLKATGSPDGAVITIIPNALVDEADRRRREMIAAAVHDLRHPITVQSLAIELLAAQMKQADDDRLLLLEKLRRSTAFLTASVDDLLNRMLFDLDMLSVHPQVLEAFPALKAIAWQIQPLLDRRRQHLQLNVPAGMLLRVDPAALEHMVANLVLNAHKYSVDGDRIDVAVRARPQQHATEIQIRDHGPGISVAERRRVFDRFYRGDSAKQQRGAGLGLTIVQSLAALHGGAVGVRAARGGGALFWIRLPDPPVREATYTP